MTAQKQRIIVESKMSTGQIQLGVKESSGKSPDRYSTQGFFYAGCKGEAEIGTAILSVHRSLPTDGIPQTPNFSDNLCWQWHYPKRYEVATSFATALPAPFQNNFYDNPSRKRLARCTNIPHTGALPTVKGVGQRLRKGFKRQWRGSLTIKTAFKSAGAWGGHTKVNCFLKATRNIVADQLPVLKSLSSAAKIRHPARNTRL